jgi:RNA polymerase sigma factor (sigma-70 family)
LEGWSEFHAQVERLPEPEREVFSLIWYQGLNQKEVQEVLGVSLRTIKRRWQTARLLLYDTLHGDKPG